MYKRILIKVSGESLQGKEDSIDSSKLKIFAAEIIKLKGFPKIEKSPTHFQFLLSESYMSRTALFNASSQSRSEIVPVVFTPILDCVLMVCNSVTISFIRLYFCFSVKFTILNC